MWIRVNNCTKISGNVRSESNSAAAPALLISKCLVIHGGHLSCNQEQQQKKSQFHAYISAVGLWKLALKGCCSSLGPSISPFLSVCSVWRTISLSLEVGIRRRERPQPHWPKPTNGMEDIANTIQKWAILTDDDDDDGLKSKSLTFSGAVLKNLKKKLFGWKIFHGVLMMGEVESGKK